MSALSDPRSSSGELPTEVIDPVSGSEPCRSCGSVVGRDQRYCLGCGERKAGSKVPFAETLAPAAPAAAPAAAATARGGLGPGLATAIVCLSVLFLGTGVLIGRGNGSGSAQVSAAPAAVTTVQQSGGEVADAGSAGAPKATTRAKAATDGQGKAAAPPVVSGAKKAALDKAVKCRTTAECQEASKKIPNEFTTPGKPPPVDGKAPAGGAQGQTFQ